MISWIRRRKFGPSSLPMGGARRCVCRRRFGLGGGSAGEACAGGVLLEPVEDRKSRMAEIEAMFARIDELRGDYLFPEREEQPPTEERDPIL